ncbi:hypothetical protein [Marimonas lutisalis]|uniref:hypothetical protein n=1 Tax=Marimonas lutisalis TaxID=2545756 RepID=UPI0010F69369|nr:hypothetical protein [Marimonas lutisalis]
MDILRKITTLWAMLAFLVLAACASAPQSRDDQIADLARAIQAMGPNIEPAEAYRAAEIAHLYPLQLASQWQVSDSPLLHNTKVNMGLRPRGLCWHWAEAMERRLQQEQFETLSIHRAIANSDNPLRIDHSTAIISSMGEGMYQGIVLDPWRAGYGRLTWTPTRTDPDYAWKPRLEVLATKRERARRRARN